MRKDASKAVKPVAFAQKAFSGTMTLGSVFPNLVVMNIDIINLPIELHTLLSVFLGK